MIKRLLCWWRTGHAWEALGSRLLRTGPHYVYRCKHCHSWKKVPWP